MKTPERDLSAGNAVIAGLLFAFLAAALMGGYVAYAARDALQTQRMIDYQKARIAAECALDHAEIALRNIVLANQLTLSTSELQSLIDAIQPPDPLPPYLYETPDGRAAFNITVDSDVNFGNIPAGKRKGYNGEWQRFSVRTGAINPKTGAGCVLRLDMMALGLFLIRFGVFYENDLEINPGANMTFAGPVHCNEDMHICPDASSLRFNDQLTAHGNIFRQRKDRSQDPGYIGINNQSDIEIAMTFDSTAPYWMINALWYWGNRCLSGAHGVEHLGPPINATDVPYDLIRRALPPTDPNYHIETENEKYHNKACLKIHINSNGVITARDALGADVSSYFKTNAVLRTNSCPWNGRATYIKDADGNYLFLTNGILNITNNYFYDAREGVTNWPVDVYVDRLTNMFPQAFNTTYSIEQGRGLIYITRDQPRGTATNTVRPVLRIRNGNRLPNSGLTFATDMPIYLEGNYNTQTVKPAMLAGDAVTFLSKGWQDACSWGTVSQRTATNTTYNTVVLTGNSETTWGNYNGGLENVLRFLENWSGKTVVYRGSIIDLWYSQKAKGRWVYGTYYTAPTRDWGYDPIYRTQVPPGCTRVFGIEEITWKQSTWDQETW